MRFIEIEFQSDRFAEEVELRNRLLRIPLGLSLSEEEIREEAQQFHFGLINDNDQLVACAIIVPIDEHHVKFRQMAVDQDHQGRGLGARLIAAIERELVSRGIRSVEMHARSAVLEFYKKQGYREIGSEFTEVGIPHRKMIKDLSAEEVV
jgi:predicted GNAT family N-acyltransferase